LSFLDRIAECNRHDPSRYVPFTVDGRVVGHVRRDHVRALSAFPEIQSRDGTLSLAAFLDAEDLRTAAMNKITRVMCARGVCDPWRGEPYPVGLKFGDSLCEVERAGAELFGITAYGVHLTGYVRDGDAVSVWVPRRTAERPTYPGELDNTVAGGQPAALSVVENLIKECDEEAAIPRALAEQARPVGALSYAVDGRVGLKREVIFNYDLDLPLDFVPKNQDGEVEDFQLWPVERAMEVVETTADFKFNCALVLIDFFVRHGLIGPDHPDYVDICAGLNN
jgi:hypothetical protein